MRRLRDIHKDVLVRLLTSIRRHATDTCAAARTPTFLKDTKPCNLYCPVVQIEAVRLRSGARNCLGLPEGLMVSGWKSLRLTCRPFKCSEGRVG